MLRIIARCVRGLEWVLSEEVATRLDPPRITLGHREVTFDQPQLTDQLLDLRTADDLLLELDAFGGVGHTKAALDELAWKLGHASVRGRYHRAPGVLATLRELPRAPTLDVVAALTGRRNYNRYAVEDITGEVIGPLLNARYVSRNPLTGPAQSPAQSQSQSPGQQLDPGQCDLTARLFLTDDRVLVGLRIPLRPTHRRPWKRHTGPGTLHPPVAAALSRICGVRGDEVVLDPFCGDGTIVIEAAANAAAAPAGSANQFRALACDLDQNRLANARFNAAMAQETADGGALAFVRADAGHPPWRPGSVDAIITNPPWNRAVKGGGSLTDTMDAFWEAVPVLLSERGRICLVADAESGARERAEQHGFHVRLAQHVRLAGRMSVILLAVPSGSQYTAQLRESLVDHRRSAIDRGVTSCEGF